MSEKNIEPEYTLDIKLDTCNVSSKYQTNSTVLFLLIAYSYNIQEIGFASNTNLVLNVKLKKGDNLVFEKKYSVKNEQPFIKKVNSTIYPIRSDFMINMGESLSLGTKECIEQIISDINKIIKH